ncbi:MAG: thiol:disulfide interchange protein DsbA/DsbL [Hydrogenophaga sp.]|nr:thiol:disulfide interchange protein DsbA/DsbL [Hydrogenophaga sp.]
MQRREFSRSLLAAGASTAVGAAGALALLPAHAQTAGLKEGTDFVRLPRPAPVDSPADKIEVVEFFAYSCIHCYNFEPLLSDWMKKKPASVVVRRTPVAFNESFVPMQRLYYALEAMGQVDALHEKAFRAIHVEKQRFTNPDTIVAWAVAQGLDREKFVGFFNSFAVAGKAKRAAQLQDAYGVEGTPSLGVGGRFYVTGQGPRTLVVADALIADLRKA